MSKHSESSLPPEGSPEYGSELEKLQAKNVELQADNVELRAENVQLRAENVRLKEEALTDELTGIGNLRFFKEELDRLGEMAKRDGTPLALIALDLDQFKQVNEGPGHPAGDRLLVEVAEVLENKTRASDRPFRVGGDEFIITLPNTNEQDVEIVLNTLHQFMPEHPVTHEQMDFDVSVGIYRPGGDQPDAYQTYLHVWSALKQGH